ncbi:cbb3-type cytochrome c oxidase subunit I [Mycobacterium koreense]|uniref:Nitric-oxide reductase large subunit n=1 Tax=Mycolicibacillus koreensis TaxID=1069220 RepID=A0A7I7SCU9_9MYCO|nr:cbb3-type cytochrome c oxidase subunit I [Mycolicibacillus koreensis]MCV7249898.1 cbb3-type cytochrome c oxidase subunit I [Mycolicibacillus koreensis]ODR11241.1 nitric oxide reductase [Mycolicibacillus koreensis]OSC34882.1 nitric-oxide reductase large subunit [Mycolicibacillus koreensis]BBY54747.1 nitric oxide reductase [Mycolicibacillus koreensis]
MATTESVPPGSPTPSQPLIGKGWLQGVALVMIFGFFVMGILVYRTYTASMPLPEKVVTESGQSLFTGDDITHGQELFQARGLMQYGSVLGHGAYLGPDYTAEYLRLATDNVADQFRDQGLADPHEAVVNEFRTNRYNADTKTLVFTDKQARAFSDIERYYADYFGEDSTKYGLLPKMITDPGEIRDLTAFFAWTAWASAAERPGHNYSYTNNWPAESRVDNGPTGSIVVWSVLSLIALLGGTGIMFAIYGRWSQNLGWHGAEMTKLSFTQPGEVGLTKSQRAAIWFFAVVSVLYLGQTLLGGAVEHYRADLSAFYGIDLAKILPYNLARTWHVQLSLFWTAAAFLAGGIFLVPFITRREPRRQHWLAYGLLGAVAVVVFGSLISEALSIFKVIPEGGLFSQQWEYLDLPRLWQILLVVGLFLWIAIIWRGMRGTLATTSKMNLPWLFFFTGLAIPAFYAVGLLAGSDTHFSVADFWRFWVVHLWVEDFLELFTTVLVAYMFVLLGVVRQRVALGVIFLDIILYSAGGVIGTMHHLYFSGTPVEHMALGAFFSAAEVIPLTFLTVEAWAFLQLGSRQEAGDGKPFPARWAVMFLVAVGFWNFLGAGVFGFLINLPIVSYYEIGTALTANHAHGAMLGVYGMLAVALAMFAFRYVIPPEKWPERMARISFWCMNIGLAWMVFATLLPLGVLQLFHSVNNGYFEARSLGYITQPGNSILEWLRLPGDAILIVGGVVPFVWIAWTALRNFRSGITVDELPENALYTELPAAQPSTKE